MTGQNNTPSNTEAMWFFMRAYIWVASTLQSILTWFSPVTENYPVDEAGELIRRQIANKSWFDEITHWWARKSAFEKISNITAITIVSGFIGLFIGVPTLFALTAAFFSLGAHALILSHEEHRRAAAFLAAQETISLNNQLKLSSDMLHKTRDALHNAIDALKSQGDKVAAQAMTFEEQSHATQQLHSQLAPVVNAITVESSQLLEKTQLVNTEMSTIGDDLKACHRVIEKATNEASSLNEPIANLSEATLALHKSQEKFSHVTDRLCLFVNAQTSPGAPAVSGHRHDASLAAVEAFLDDNERLMNEWRKEMGAGAF